MAERPLVSVVMPAYNTSPWVASAIRSALSQSVRDIEVLVVDDGSTDDTLAAATQAAAGDPRVRVMTQTNAGPSAARNRAMRLAQGAFFALLDSDDEWAPAFLEAQLAVFARTPSIAIVTANAFNRGGTLDGTPYRPIRSGERTLSFVDILREEDAVCIMSVFRRSVYDAVGPFNESLRGNEDYEFWLRAARAGFEIAQTFEPHAYYRRRPDSASADDLKMAAGILNVFGMIRSQCSTSTERDVVDAQVTRFERALLSLNASAALRSGRYRAAAGYYEQLHRASGDARSRTLLLASRYVPGLLSTAAGVRRWLRQSALRVGSGKNTSYPGEKKIA
jgi:hypothetical protein